MKFMLAFGALALTLLPIRFSADEASVESVAQKASCQSHVEYVADSKMALLAGPIDTCMSKQFVNAAKNNDIELVLMSSSGGNIEAAMEIGRTIKANGYPLALSGACFSSCAQYVLPAADRVLMDDTTILGLHGTASSRQKIIGARLHEKSQMAFVTSLALKEQDYYAEMGLQPASLFNAHEKISMSCVNNLYNSGQQTGIAFKRPHNLYVPRFEDIEAEFNVQFFGPRPASDADYQQRLEGARSGHDFKELYFWEDAPTIALDQIPDCSDVKTGGRQTLAALR